MLEIASGEAGAFRRVVLAAALVFLLPLAGVAATGKPLSPYLEFPPRTSHAAHPPFSLPVFLFLAFIEVAATWPFLRRMASFAGIAGGRKPALPFPWWGWAGLAAGGVCWVVAWSRFHWMGRLQAHTFTPLWLSFILVANALTVRRTGRCLILSRPHRFLLLFPASAAFWWTFEYLNRFVGNWHYIGEKGFGPIEYFLFATLPFSTVLPAVLSVRELLRTFPRFDGPFLDRRPLSPPSPKRTAWAALILSCAGLALVGVVPDAVFPLVWIAPPLLLISLAALRRAPHALSGIASGDWRSVVSSALAAVLCGFFWEMWNFGSQAKWVYAIPYVDVLHVFEMPLLGYAGYLPFGVLCAEIGDNFLA